MIADSMSVQGSAMSPIPIPGVQTPEQQGFSDVFLQLLLKELINQDPLDPVKGADFIAQLAQLGTVEQMQKVNTRLDEMSNSMQAAYAAQQLAQATALIGRSVQAVGPGGTTVEGQVMAVRLMDGIVSLEVNGLAISLSSVLAVIDTPEDESLSQVASASEDV